MIKGLFSLAVFIGGIYVAYVFTSPMIKNSMLEKKMYEVTRTLTAKSEASVRKEIMAYIHEKDIDIDEREIVVIVREPTTSLGNENKVTIAGHYSTEVTFLNYSHQYEFFPASDDAARLNWKGKGAQGVRNY
jgi:hypothetical protein